MKMLTAVLLLISSAATAEPYFRVVNPAHPQKVAGAFVDPVNPSATSVGTALALVTHSTRDGCLLPTVVCEDWSPLMAGLSVNAGRVQFSMGPAMNLSPVVKAGLLRLLTLATATETLAGVKSALGSQPISGPDVSLSFGPALAISPIQRGIVIPVSEWKGRAVIFAGAALTF